MNIIYVVAVWHLLVQEASALKSDGGILKNERKQVDDMFAEIDAEGNVGPLATHVLKGRRQVASVIDQRDTQKVIDKHSWMRSRTKQKKKNPSIKKATDAREVVICRGVGDLKEDQFEELSRVWGRYAEAGVITATSTLLYKIDSDGHFVAFGTDDDALERKTQHYLTPAGVKSLPHVWCDASCCKTCDLPVALQQAMLRKEEFFAESVAAAAKYGWNGYALDFEGKMPSSRDTTEFFAEWQQELAKHASASGMPLELHLWSASGADEVALAQHMTSVVDMSAYSFPSYDSLAADAITLESQTRSWREVRRKGLLQTDGTSTICPAASMKLTSSSSRRQHGLIESVSVTNASRDGESSWDDYNLKSEITKWCNRIGHKKCAIGLITYDMGSANLGCEDMMKVAQHAREMEAQSLWIWSGGMFNAAWETGLHHYLHGADEESQSRPQEACSKRLDVLGAQLWSGEGAPCDGCHFDAQFCCDGQPRRVGTQ